MRDLLSVYSKGIVASSMSASLSTMRE